MAGGKGVALVTGASSGIGAVYADRLAKRGHGLLLVARDEARLAALAGRLRAETGVSVETLKADLNAAEDLRGVEARLASDETISMLVNNAGVAAVTPLIHSDVEQLDAMVRLNVRAATRLAAAAASAFAARKSGTIVNIASVVGLAPEMLNGVYGASKAYVLALTQSMHHELSPQGVRVQAVLPGATATEIWERAGHSVEALPAEIVMPAGAMVDAALAGLDLGEVVTIPSLPDVGQWEAFEAARAALGPNLSRREPASRYLAAASAAA
ncbi:SDR family oxidoreductase [Chelatococcus sambhunathii]|uniref:NADP-dependent 3-hydroxy acid dehydrogenase YdfG n=1 Tax=Chelatococcus sambhunathii TaxID=363953 RepID=A0ABU1DHN1_9HYPH|nr:SDR family oxidoreductase [Chelatococcus sambhunathii]MDR4307599.1 SDR family oxidoreductase [Chelatococcus sambhunathii]